MDSPPTLLGPNIMSAGPSNTLSTIPTELLIHIFKSADDFSTVSALSRACRNFHEVWQTYNSSICDAVLPRAIVCFDELVELDNSWWDMNRPFFMLQSHNQEPQECKSHKGNSDDQVYADHLRKRTSYGCAINPRQVGACRAAHLLSEANAARSASEIFNSIAGNADGRSALNNSTQVFIRTWYRTLTLVHTTAHKDYITILSKLALLDVFQMIKNLHILLRPSQSSRLLRAASIYTWTLLRSPLLTNDSSEPAAYRAARSPIRLEGQLVES